MEKINELECYEIALREYIARRDELDNEYDEGVELFGFGLCRYFFYRFNMENKESNYGSKWFPSCFPILYSLNPKTDIYWFEMGHLSPRIELLEKAIEILKNKEK